MQVVQEELTKYVVDEMLTLIQQTMRVGQTFVANIEQQAFSISFVNPRCPCPILRSNTDEGDLVWLHCLHSFGNRKLIYSRERRVPHWTHPDG